MGGPIQELRTLANLSAEERDCYPPVRCYWPNRGRRSNSRGVGVLVWTDKARVVYGFGIPLGGRRQASPYLRFTGCFCLQSLLAPARLSQRINVGTVAVVTAATGE